MNTFIIKKFGDSIRSIYLEHSIATTAFIENYSKSNKKSNLQLIEIKTTVAFSSMVALPTTFSIT